MICTNFGRNKKQSIMKKLLFTICLLAFATLHITAQNVIGVWNSSINIGEKDPLNLTMNIKNKTDLGIIITMEVREENDMYMKFHIEADGTYTLKDDIITLSVDSTSAKGSIDELKFSGEAEELIKNKPELKEMMEQIMDKMADQIKVGVMSSLSALKGVELVIEELTDRTMKLREKEETLIFNKVQ